MKRRRLVLLVSAVALGTIGMLAIATLLFFTRTQAGRDRLGRIATPLVANVIKGGSVHLGRISAISVTQVTVDTFAIRDKHNNELFLSTGRLTLSFDPRDLANNRILIRSVQVEHPYVHIVQHQNNAWNFKEIFRSENTGPPTPKSANRRALGDYVVIDSVTARNTTFLLTMPWHPDDSLRGAKRDSAIRVHVENPQKMVAKTDDGYGRTYAWRNGSGLIEHARLADPDSDRFGREIKIATLSVDEYEPTFQFRNVKGVVRLLADSAFFTIPHFDMPASTGSGRGKVWWGNGPVRYDIAIHGDSVSLNDVNWAYTTLPRTGGGTLDLLIKNDPKNEHIIDFHLRKADVRTTGSHLVGNMSFGINAPVLLVRNVDLRADPVDFDFLRALAGKPWPMDWRGQLYGTVKARGGPLTNFFVDDARGTFHDAHVPGAISRFAAHGELDILVPAQTSFHHFDVDAGAIDLRSIEAVSPSFPKLGGIISGTATLDSSYLDVRFSNAHLVHQDGPGEPSRVSGSGRITYGDLMSYDLTLDAQPLSLTMVGRSYKGFPLRGLVSGPIKLRGTAPDLQASWSLQGPVGTITYEGTIDADSVGGFGGRGHGQFSGVNLAAMLERPSIRSGPLSGHYDADIIIESASSIRGSALIDLESTMFDGLRVYPSHAAVRFADGQMKVDSLLVQTVAFRASAGKGGGIGLPKGRPDSLNISVTIDSVGGFRRYISGRDTTVLAAAVPDSIAGSASVQATVSGTFDHLDIRGLASASAVYVNKYAGDTASATFDLRNVTDAFSGTISGKIDSVSLPVVTLSSLGGTLQFTDLTHTRFAATAVSRNGPTASATGVWNRANGGHDVVLDSLGLAIAESRWRLAGPARLTIDSTDIRLDSLMLRNADSAFVFVDGNIPEVGAAFGRVRAARVPLRDVGVLAQLADTLDGFAQLNASVAGTKARPQIAADAAISKVKWRSVDIDAINGNAQYADGRIRGDVDMLMGGKRSLTATASIPANVTLFSVAARDDSISGLLIADTTNLEIVKTLLPALAPSRIAGRLTANIEAGGTWNQKVFRGRASVADGSVFVPQLNMTFSRINGLVDGRNAGTLDSIGVTLQASTDVGDRGRPTGSAVLEGFVKDVFKKDATKAIALSLRTNGFHVMNKRTLADLSITTTNPIRLTGTNVAPVLTGSLSVDRSSIFLLDADLARKQAVEIIADDATSSNQSSSAVWSSILTNLRVQDVSIVLGDNVRLRSAEANVKLVGSLQLVTSTRRSTRTLASTGQLIPIPELEGTLRTDGGTYNLNLGFLQREFTVLSDGTVTFDGPWKNPQLDIRALYNVKRPGDRDLGVIVNLHGRLLPNPVIDFSSNSDYTIATSDLLSYLLTGKPGFDFAANGRTSQTIAAFLAPTISAYTADKLRQTLPWLDVFQLQLGTSSATQTTGTTFFNTANEYLSTSTIYAEKSFKNLFLGLNTGLCSLSNNQNVSPLNAVGGKAELRIDPRLSIKAAYDPPTIGRICGGSQAVIGLPPSPGQFSLAFTHTWRF